MADTTKGGGEIDLSALKPTARRAHEEREQAEAQALQKTDGRTLRRRGRSETFSTKTTLEVIQTIQRIAQVEGVGMVDVFEAAIRDYDKRLRGVR